MRCHCYYLPSPFNQKCLSVVVCFERVPLVGRGVRGAVPGEHVVLPRHQRGGASQKGGEGSRVDAHYIPALVLSCDNLWPGLGSNGGDSELHSPQPS